jgi:outer membrane protein OmpA-like peptidoglycan-associated protein
MKPLRLIVVLLTLTGMALAQPGKMPLSSTNKKALKNYEQAQLKFDQKKDNEAIQLLNKSIEADPNFIEAYVFLNEVLMVNRQFEKAIEAGEKAIRVNTDYFPVLHYNMGLAHFDLGKYTEAIRYLDYFVSYPRLSEATKKQGRMLLESARFAEHAIKNPVEFKPRNLGKNVNSELNEYLPSLTADEEKLVFTVLVPTNPSKPDDMRYMFEDFFISEWKNNEWQPRYNPGPPLNSPGNDGAQCVSADGQVIFFTACEEANGYPGGRKGFGSCDIFYTRKTDEGYTPPENLGNPISSRNWDAQPSITADGSTLYFVSNRPGGKGGKDIWRSTLSAEGYWGKPECLGDSVNTPGNEESPFIHADGVSLYFSSDGHPGMGKADLFLSRIKPDGSFSRPVNLGYPINTKDNERDFIVNAAGTKAYFSADRPEGFGGQDIYEFDLPVHLRPRKVSYVKGRIKDATNNKPIAAIVELIDLSSGQTIQKMPSNKKGEFLVCIQAEKNYAFNISRKDYLFYSENYSFEGSNALKPQLVEIPLSPIREGEKVVLRNIFFKTGSSTLEKESESELQKLVGLLSNNPSMKIEISGHTDNVGDAKSNQLLSENRAKAVYDYLIEKRIASDRLSYKGYGMSQPIASNDTDEGRAQNRRTEFKIVK